MKRVWKFPLELGRDMWFELPNGSQVVRFAQQGSELCMWMLHDPSAGTEPRRFRIYGTGQEIPDEGVWLASCEHGGVSIWHLFELCPPPDPTPAERS